MRASFRFAPLLAVLLVGIALAQGAPSPVPQVPGNTVPAWVLYWVLGLVTVGATIWMGVTKILWDRGSRASNLTEEERDWLRGLHVWREDSVLTEDEKGWLRQLYFWHKAVDDDQIPLWYVPRSWVDLLHKIREDNAVEQALLTKLTEQTDGLIADLREQLKDSRGSQAQQQTKMLKLAVRVQRAVEALAGLHQPPEIEDDLDDDDDDV